MRMAPQLILVVLVLVATAAGIVWLMRASPDRGIEIVLPDPTATPVVVLKAYISGAVRSPGVYGMSKGDRLAELVEAAGGATDDADLSAVNLAARVEDEDHWHIPRPGETAAAGTVSPVSTRMDINTASTSQLVELPRIGEIIAQRIIDYREANGPFSSVEDLLAVQGIGPDTLAGIRDLVEVR